MNMMVEYNIEDIKSRELCDCRGYQEKNDTYSIDESLHIKFIQQYTPIRGNTRKEMK